MHHILTDAAGAHRAGARRGWVRRPARRFPSGLARVVHCAQRAADRR